MWQATCGVVIRSVRNENGGGGSSPGWISSPAQSIVRAVEPRRRAGLEPPEREAGARQGLRQPARRRLADPAGRDLLLADMNEAVAGRCRSSARRGRRRSDGRRRATTPAARPRSSSSRSSAAPSAMSRLGVSASRSAIAPAIELAVGLGARAAHRRPLAAVEHAELDAGAVDGAAHDAVERVDLAHQMALAEPADRRVARHLADRRALVGQQERARAEPRRGRRRLAPGMPAADHDDVVTSAKARSWRAECMKERPRCRGFA